MNKVAPEIFRKRLLIEGFFRKDVSDQTILDFFALITTELKLKVYGGPIVHATSGAGKEANQGFDAFIPLIDSGIYIAVWTNQKFLSLIIYTCKDFGEDEALLATIRFFDLQQYDHKLF